MTTFKKGDKVQEIYGGKIFVVKCACWQNYAGEQDQTVEFEPTTDQPTPWNRGSNLRLVLDAVDNEALKMQEALTNVKSQIDYGTSKHAAISFATALYNLSEADAMCLVAEIG